MIILKPLIAQELEQVIKELQDKNYDPEGMHGIYETILERYCLHPDPALAELIKKLITEIRPQVNFWYA